LNKLKHAVFWPPFVLLVAAAFFGLMDAEGFVQYAKVINDIILAKFSWLFSGATLVFLIVCVWVYFSPLGKIRIGGKDARPLLTKWRWFSITLCTTIATGILFWGMIEPTYHLNEPPLGLDIVPGGADAKRFAMSSLYLHWTLTPYAIYTLAGLMFALMYYNMKQPFSLGSMLYPAFGKKVYRGWDKAIDAISLFSLVAGMAASLGAGMLTLSGGLERYFGLSGGPLLLACLGGLIVFVFILSAASGLMKGIRILSDINTRAFFLLAIFIFVFGPTIYLLEIGLEGLGDYVTHFFAKSLYTGAAANDPWPRSWSTFYWANWLAWTPVTALFLGRLSYGYTVREFIKFNLLYTSVFSFVWMTIFGGTAIFYAEELGLYEVLQQQGGENILYVVLDQFPLAKGIGIGFLLIAFLSYVTAADSNISAVGGISSEGITPESPEPALGIKIIWGVTIGLISWIMVAFAGIDGIKMTSTLGGFPALLLVLGIVWGMIKLVRNPSKLKQ